MERTGKVSLPQRKIQRLQLKLEHTEETIATLYENLAEGILSNEDYQEIKLHYTSEKEKLSRELQEAEQEKREADLRLEKFMDLEAHLEQYLGETALSEQLIRELVERIEIGREKRVEIRFSCEDVMEQVMEMTEGIE
jgi:chromosome segregation ATPase